MLQLSPLPTQPVLPGRTSRASSFRPAPGTRRCCEAEPGALDSVNSMASTVPPERLSKPLRPGSSSDPSDRSHGTAGRLRLAPVRGLAAPVAVSASATACLQSNPTGQLHSANSNSRSEPFRVEKLTTVA